MLIKCPECGNEISDKAISCPSCGCKLRNANTKKKFGVILAVFIVGTICFFTLKNSEKSQTQNNNREYESTISRLNKNNEITTKVIETEIPKEENVDISQFKNRPDNIDDIEYEISFCVIDAIQNRIPQNSRNEYEYVTTLSCTDRERTNNWNRITMVLFDKEDENYMYFYISDRYIGEIRNNKIYNPKNDDDKENEIKRLIDELEYWNHEGSIITTVDTLNGKEGLIAVDDQAIYDYVMALLDTGMYD